MLELFQLSEKLSGAGLAVLLILVLVGGYRKWWVWGWQLTEAEVRHEKEKEVYKEREQEWKNIARPSVHAAEGAANLAESAVSMVARRKGRSE